MIMRPSFATSRPPFRGSPTSATSGSARSPSNNNNNNNNNKTNNIIILLSLL